MAATQITTAPLMTAEELFQLPDDDYKYELVEGGLIRMPPNAIKLAFFVSFDFAPLRSGRAEKGRAC
jgi:hypothetical protein